MLERGGELFSLRNGNKEKLYAVLAAHAFHPLQKKIIGEGKKGMHYCSEGNALYKLLKFIPPKLECRFHCSEKNRALLIRGIQTSLPSWFLSA